MLVFSSLSRKPWRALTLMVPVAESGGAPPAVTPTYDAGGLPVGFDVQLARTLVHIAVS
jgi:hypothetical protein